MTDATLHSPIPVPMDRSTSRDRLVIGPTLWLAVFAVLAMSLPNLADPMLRYDDFPALFADGDMYWPKTLNEGRWYNYIWHLRGVVTPAWLNHVAFQVLWAVFAAATATVATRQGGSAFFRTVLALVILVSPSALMVSLWFNTLLPGQALMTLYAVLACRLSDRALRRLLPVFVVLSFMAYTLFPLLLLTICLLRQDERSVLRLAGILAMFTASIAAAVLLTYAINWQVHGVFGVPLADWRETTPAQDLSGLIANLPKLGKTLADFMAMSSFGFAPAQVFHAVLFAGSALVLLRRAPMEALYLHAALITGVTLVAAQVLKLGMPVPARAVVFVWVLYGISIVRAAELLGRDGAIAGRLARNAVLLIVGSYLVQGFQQVIQYRDWQSETRQIARAIADAPAPIVVVGAPMDIASARRAGVQSDIAFQFRMRQLAGRNVILCPQDGAACTRALPALPAAAGAGADSAPLLITKGASGTLLEFKGPNGSRSGG